MQMDLSRQECATIIQGLITSRLPAVIANDLSQKLQAAIQADAKEKSKDETGKDDTGGPVSNG